MLRTLATFFLLLPIPFSLTRRESETLHTHTYLLLDIYTYTEGGIHDMPADSGEVITRSTQQIVRATQELQSAWRELGTGRDAVARDRLRRQRQIVHQCHTRVAPLLGSVPRDLQGVVEEYERERRVFEEADSEATRRETQTFKQMPIPDDGGNSADLLPAIAQDIRPVDLAELQTEDGIQREKLQHVQEIESNMLDLRATYQEFHTLVTSQQGALDEVTNNVSESRSLLERGHGQLQEASQSQKRLQKYSCIFVVIVVLLIVGALIVLT